MIEIKIEEEFGQYSYYQNPYIGIDTADRDKIKYTIKHNKFRYDYQTEMLVLVESVDIYSGMCKATKSNIDKIYLNDVLDNYLQGNDEYDRIVRGGNASTIAIANASWFTVDVEVYGKTSVTYRWSYLFGYDGAREPFVNTNAINATIQTTFGYNHLFNVVNTKKEIHSNQPIYIKFGYIEGGSELQMFVDGNHRATHKATPYGLVKFNMNPSWFNMENGNKVKFILNIKDGPSVEQTLQGIPEHCGDFLHIKNQWGGIDVLPVNTSTNKKVNVARNKFTNNDRDINYTNILTDSYTIRTLRMRDCDYSLIRSVIITKESWLRTEVTRSINNSSNIYALDYLPIIINTDSIDEKTFKKDKIFQYMFDAQVAIKNQI